MSLQQNRRISFSDMNRSLTVTNGNTGIGTTAPAHLLDVNGGVRSTNFTTTNALITNVTTGTLNATNITVTNVLATTYTGGSMGLTGAANAVTGTIGTFVATTSSAGTAVATTYTGGSIGLTGAANAVTGTIGTFVATTSSAGTAVATTYTGGSMSLSGNLAIAGTLTTVNITTTNISETNVSAGTVAATNIGVTTQTVGTSRITTSLLALGNSNTVGNIYTTGGNIGIGTTSPGEVLDVRGNLRVGNSTQGNYISFYGTLSDGPGEWGHTYIGERFYGGSEGSELLLFKGNDISGVSGPDRIRHLAANHVFDTYTSTLNGTFAGVGTSGTTRMLIDQNGNVGVGTTAPRSNLEISQSSSTTGVMLYSGLDSGGVNSIFFNHSGTQGDYRKVAIQTQALGSGQGGRSNLALCVNTANNSTNVTMSDAKLFIQGSSGNVGIGTNSPSNNLHVYGSVDSEITIKLENANTGTSACSIIRLASNAGQGVMFMNGLNRTSDGGASTMTIRNDPGSLRLQGGASGNSTLWLSTGGNIGIGTTSPSALLQLNTGGTVLMQLNTAGKLSVLDDVIAFASFSDRRLKTDIETVSELDAVDVVNALRPVTFKWKETISNPGKRGVLDIGFIAQEVEEVTPYAVEEFTDMAENVEYKRIKHERLLPYLVASIQHLTKSLDDLKSEFEQFKKSL